MSAPLKIGVYGSSSGDLGAHASQVARELGRRIARRGHVLITGGCKGVPYDAVQGAMEEGGRCVAYSPHASAEAHGKVDPVEGFAEFVYVPEAYEHVANVKVARKYRNISSVAACDAAVIVSGQIGTLNEFTNAYDFGKPIGSILGTGGVADFLPELTDRIRKEPRPFLVFSADIDEVLNALEKHVDGHS